MSYTCTDVFNRALAIIDAVDDADTSDYENRTVAILNILQGELFPFSDTWSARDDGKRPVLDELTSMEDVIQLDDYICGTVMPYGLAAHWMLNEDGNTANYAEQRYEELKEKLSVGMPSESVDIYDVYSSSWTDPATGKKYQRNPIGFEWTTRW